MRIFKKRNHYQNNKFSLSFICKCSIVRISSTKISFFREEYSLLLTFLGKNLRKLEQKLESACEFPRHGAFGVTVQWRITRDEIEATAKLGNYPNIPLDVNDASELAAFAILPLPCITVLQSRGHKLHEARGRAYPLLSAVSVETIFEDWKISSQLYREFMRILTENRLDPRYHVY